MYRPKGKILEHNTPPPLHFPNVRPLFLCFQLSNVFLPLSGLWLIASHGAKPRKGSLGAENADVSCLPSLAWLLTYTVQEKHTHTLVLLLSVPDCTSSKAVSQQLLLH